MTAHKAQPPCPASWPESCEALRLDDTVMGQAYDNVPPALRACIKTGIAFQYALHGEHPNHEARYVSDSARGFSHCVQYRPAAWTMLFLGPDYASGSRLVAALMPALLARVPLVGLACIGALPSQAVCASLELVGVEDIFCLADLAAAQKFLQQLADSETSCVQGRTLFLHKGELAPLEHTARRLNLVVWQEVAAPRIVLHAHCGCDAKTLHWCHPDAQFISGDDSTVLQADAVFGPNPPMIQSTQTKQSAFCGPSAPLSLGAGTEGLWWHKNLEPDFFVEKQLHASCTEHREAIL